MYSQCPNIHICCIISNRFRKDTFPKLFQVHLQNKMVNSMWVLQPVSFGILMYQCFYKIANRLESRSCPTYAGPDLGSSLFVVLKTIVSFLEYCQKWIFFKMTSFSRPPFCIPAYNGNVFVLACRHLIHTIVMTSCDLVASAKPWRMQLDTVKYIFEEFYQQVPDDDDIVVLHPGQGGADLHIQTSVRLSTLQLS